MRNAIGIAMAAIIGLGLAWSGGVGRAQQEGVGEKVGEKLDEAGRKLKQGLNRAEDAVREGFNKTKDSVQGMGVQARVYGRLHWDKALTKSDLRVKVERGIATLNGAVPSTEARTKAITLAAETVGVTRVVSELTITATAADAIPAVKP